MGKVGWFFGLPISAVDSLLFHVRGSHATLIVVYLTMTRRW